MDILSLNEPSPAPARRVSRAEAIGASMLVHVLLLLLFMRGVDGLPEPLARWLRAHAARPPAAAAAAPATPEEAARQAQEKAKEKEKPIPPIPLKFSYVKVPEDAEPRRNPDASRLSDRDRIARQEVPTPPDASQFTRDPHAQGDTRDKVRPDPRIKAGRDTPDRPSPETDRIASRDVTGRRGDAVPGPEGDADKAGEEAGEADEARAQEKDDPPPPPEANGRPAEFLPGVPRRKSSTGGGGATGGSAASRTPNLKDGSESKFHFDNPGWLRGGMQGTLSFDTKGFPWGDYARKIYVIIRENWISREPVLSRFGAVPDYTCQRFVIERDGSISSVDVLRRSGQPPYDKAATDALHASSALPPLPDEFKEDREGVTGCFFYNMYPEESD